MKRKNIEDLRESTGSMNSRQRRNFRRNHPDKLKQMIKDFLLENRDRLKGVDFTSVPGKINCLHPKQSDQPRTGLYDIKSLKDYIA